MQRFFIQSPEKRGQRLFIAQPDTLHHAKDVLRLKPGEEAVVFDGSGNEYACAVEEIADKLILKIRKTHLAEKGVNKIMKITVACAIPKKANMDEIIDKLTQLGVERIIPLETERVIVKLDAGKKVQRKARWEKIALAAAQQSQRKTVPVIGPISSLGEVLKASGQFALKLIPTLVGRREKIGTVLFFKEKKSAEKIEPSLFFKNILVLIGPEGDFTDEEVKLSREKGCIPVSLGELVLRVDTAAIATVSFLRLYENF